MKQGVQGPVGTQGAARVPRQWPADTAVPERERDAGVHGAARGEHTHGETPLPGPRTGPQGAPGRESSIPGSSVPRPSVQRSSVRGQVLDALRTALVAGELKPGEVYSAPVLGERFGVSATPVREAMQQLAGEGAVEVATGHVAFLPNTQEFFIACERRRHRVHPIGRASCRERV